MKLLVIVFISVLSFVVQANIKILSSQIEFSAVGKPAFIKANGNVPLSQANFNLKDDQLSGTAIVNLEKLDSGIEMRDQHLKEKYLETKKFPTATLEIKSQKVSLEGKKSEIEATLDFHGKKKPIKLFMELRKKDKTIVMKSNFDFSLTEFGVELPSFQGITAADQVKLNIDTTFEL